MKGYLKELKESFYTHEWKTDQFTATLGNITLWVANGASFFTGYQCPFHIPCVYRGMMLRHFHKGQSTLMMSKAILASKNVL